MRNLVSCASQSLDPIIEVAAPLPNINKYEIGMLTLEELYELRNPTDWETHSIPSETVQTLNFPEFVDEQSTNVYSDNENQWIGVWDGSFPIGWKYIYDYKTLTLYSYGATAPPVGDFLGEYEVENYASFKELKDIKGFQVSSQYNVKKYNQLLQRIRVGGDRLSIRTNEDEDEVVILNQDNKIIAKASGDRSTYLAVANEYRGKGLGTILGKVWYDLHPTFESGGYSKAGKKNAAIMWAERVREFLANGWYTELIKRGKITKEKVNQIQADLKTIRSGKYNPLEGV